MFTDIKTKTFAFAASSILAMLSLSACGGSTEEADLLAHLESGKVTIGTKYDQPGLAIKNPDGSMSGFDVDLATYIVNHIAEEKGWKAPEITWKEAPSAQRETLIQNGEVDLIAATYSINSSRAESINFGGPYLLTHQALLVRSDDTSISSLDDLGNGKILCSVTGSTPAQKVKEAMPGVQLQEYDTYSSCVEALRQGNIDALTTDATILNGYSEQDKGKFRVVNLEKDNQPFTNEYYGVGLAKDDQEATDAVNAALKDFYESGEFDKVKEKNLGAAEAVSKTEIGDFSFLDEK
ncbi:glutamate ABC transporter substrate-binding protein [Corynebacterium sp. sy017]|uniref:glutamate ABC transporter substrate-binding protein n=1 Tax=unclassified Corynebacterium TaxID=2624378 RepID=UPI0011851761|nr:MULTISPECIES: glutamate ABC transporter substrate-binding protein [unclassified Corynebacterium]MBP3087795.1 glutamate ABC transporter substrate-binding protein [Corynebacterium sp. sy017]QDZ42769.1 glutamate ABC transporter substrate-binding protein [Corynebacterium sp. sy039]TSD92342.1 glutamate ABC transporter substrate-binding protein [Corynebacterium sp. SY003]